MQAKINVSPLIPPDDDVLHLASLHKAFNAGDIVALLQAVSYAQQKNVQLPSWALQPLEETLIGVLQQKRGVRGRGNSAFGHMRKKFIRTVRAMAFHYVRAWQQDPHRYDDLPKQTFEHWAEKDHLLWQSYRKAIDAARLASTSLHGTDFVANASTVRRAANCFPVPIRWGRAEAEFKLGLRGPSGIFGPQTDRLKPHITSLLIKRPPKS